jgi:hypothetical protein
MKRNQGEDKVAEKEAEKERAESGDDKIEGPQAVDMTLVRLDPPKGRARAKSAAKNRVPVEFYLRMTTPLNFFMQLGPRGSGREESEFRRCVRKEPGYVAPVPFRGVAQLGDHEYPFALDCDGRRASGYNKLYFDLNHNGDLTDDKPVAASDVTSQSVAVLSQFPRIDMEIETQGKSSPYSFMLNAAARLGPDPSVTVSLYSAAIRDGFIPQGRNKTHVVLVDGNSNGRFDDVASLAGTGGMTGRGRSGLVQGDLTAGTCSPKTPPWAATATSSARRSPSARPSTGWKSRPRATRSSSPPRRRPSAMSLTPARRTGP